MRQASDEAGELMTAAGAKYFQIGFKRCGTTSLAAFFNRSGIPCAHWDRGRLGVESQEVV